MSDKFNISQVITLTTIDVFQYFLYQSWDNNINFYAVMRPPITIYKTANFINHGVLENIHHGDEYHTV